MQTNRSFFVVVFLSMAGVISPSRASAQATAETKPSACSQPLSRVESRTAYKPFKPGDVVKSNGGYGIYSEYPVNTDSFDVSSDGSVNAIFALGSRNNWISVRREFTKMQNLRGTSGLEIVVHVVTPLGHSGLRLTVSDVAAASDFKVHGNDRMWIYDLPSKRLKKTGEDLVFQIPWKKFEVPSGDGFRTGTSALGLQTDKIVGYEINFFGQGKPEVRIVSVSCY